MNSFTSMMIALTLAVTATQGCKSNDAATNSEVKYEVFPGSAQNSSCLFKIALSRPVKLCTINYGVSAQEAETIKTQVTKAFSIWTSALKTLDGSAHTTLELSACAQNAQGQITTAADQYIHMRPGSGIPTSGPGAPLTIYPWMPNLAGQALTLNMATVLHEFGHSFACLNDTYAGRQAGVCKPGQPNSVMCDNFSFQALQTDDIAGLKYNYDLYKGGRPVAQSGHPNNGTQQTAGGNSSGNVNGGDARCPAGSVFDPARGYCMSCPAGKTYNPGTGYCH